MECTEGGSAKFWRCAVSGNKTTVTFGKIGTPGAGQVKTHKSPGDALKFLATTSAAKKAKGYKPGKSSGSSAKAKAANASAMKAVKAKTKAVKAPAVTARAASSSSSGPPAKRRKGGGVDSRVPSAANFEIIGDCTVKLNQTHIDANNNKFYLIQALKSGSKYYAWNRWGRVGEDGQNKLMPCANEDAAMKEFEKKFREKTSNQWASRDSFKPVSGKYTLVETDDAGGAGDQAPMGKLTEAQIGKGQGVLKKIRAALKSKSVQSALDSLSSEYYTLIPHDFGRKRPPALSNIKMLQTQVELLKFYLRMGFEKIEDVKSLSPISGVFDLPVPKSLKEAANGLCSSGEIKESDDQGAALAKKQAGTPKKKMDPSLYAAVMLYTSNAIYTSLNQTLRDENRGKIKKYLKYLRLLFEAFDTLPQKKRTLWRGLGVDLSSNKQYAPGKTITWWGVSSCTSDSKVAKSFAAGCGGGATVITVDAKTSCDIAAISFFSNEKESLLRPGTQLKVLSNKKKGSITEVHLQEVGQAVG